MPMLASCQPSRRRRRRRRRRFPRAAAVAELAVAARLIR
jgi:hypothetical protein